MRCTGATLTKHYPTQTFSKLAFATLIQCMYILTKNLYGHASQRFSHSYHSYSTSEEMILHWKNCYNPFFNNLRCHHIQQNGFTYSKFDHLIHKWSFSKGKRNSQISLVTSYKLKNSFSQR